ncbi:hypothetical protein TAMA11512_20690 [Selenomonas sp. TAMA-11512]|uniref:sensor histidine kinase n=1 Tax=Selenomonas sp. TAMA-11512 TaxID=3095337 RepID=UPI00308B2612|nr:hypothetical protein TAMA11512_20690 [Selenomonas sp. TAMA-11512]
MAMPISVRLTVVYAGLLAIVLLFTSMVSIFGIYFSLYHQAEIEMEVSTRRVIENIRGGTQVYDESAKDFRKRMPIAYALYRDDILMPGVVLRITDENENIIFETDSHYPSIQEIQEHSTETMRPFFASDEMAVSTIQNMKIYYKVVEVRQGSRSYHLHFFRTITAERQFLSVLVRFMMGTNFIGLMLAVVAGYVVSRRALLPIRTITKMARSLEVDNLSKRIDMPVARDELAELVETLNHMLDRIQQGFEQQRVFVSSASHELRTPVTVIRGYSDMLERWGRRDPEALDEAVAAIRSEAEDMAELIERLLFLARADQNRQIVNKLPIELSELIEDEEKKMALIATEHTLTLGENDLGEVFGDPLLLKHAIRIILENAMKYTPAGGHIEVASVRAGKKMLVQISDDGIGIKEEDQKKIFDRFFRVDEARTKGVKASGTGLGLSIARWIAEQHGIEIRVRSVFGKGTTFTLEIPIHKGRIENELFDA